MAKYVVINMIKAKFTSDWLLFKAIQNFFIKNILRKAQMKTFKYQIISAGNCFIILKVY